MSINWTTESIVAAVGIVIACGGGMLTNAVQWGATTSKIDEVVQHQHEQDATISANRQALDSTIVQGAQTNQKLDDLKDQLNRIEKHLR